MISFEDYLMGRDRQYGQLLGTDLRANATRTVEIVNKLLVLLRSAGVQVEQNPATGTALTSGWRPPDINSATPGAAPRSLHITCEAADLYDPDGEIDGVLMTDPGQRILADLGLWIEHPAATKGWCHVQTRPPRSRQRVFYP